MPQHLSSTSVRVQNWSVLSESRKGRYQTTTNAVLGKYVEMRKRRAR